MDTAYVKANGRLVIPARLPREGLINSCFHEEARPWAGHQGESYGHSLARAPLCRDSPAGRQPMDTQLLRSRQQAPTREVYIR